MNFDIYIYEIKWDTIFVINKITHRKLHLKRYGSTIIKSALEGNIKLQELIKTGNPFVAGRLGYNELQMLVETLKKENNGKLRQDLKALMCSNAGFFPNEDQLFMRYGKLIQELLPSVDLLGVWDNKMEDYITKKFMPKSELCELRGLEPYYFENPWSACLKNKKILIIHPFADTIMAQFQRREKIFRNDNLLPDCDLQILQAVQTIAGAKDSRFNNWFEALDWMYKEALKRDFDIAIIGCGAYGLPLAIMLKQAGKQAIHMGGATQILFGIKGKRWDNHPVISKLYNEYWIRPNTSEQSQNNSAVEGGCYW